MRTPLLAALVFGLAASAQALDLEGTWHVLVHYTDAATHAPEQERWEDRLWVFEREGERLRWTEYPIVVFGDDSGRFERAGGNRASRVLHHWEPNDAQRAEIAAGLQVNDRGSKSKTLRRSGTIWSSGDASGGYASARFLTYTESWRIEGEPERPVFVRDDVLGSAGSESLEGRTLYTTEAVEAGGDVLRGRYLRDGSREGRFRLARSGAKQKLRGSLKSEGERVREMLFGELATQLLAGDLAPAVGEAELQRMIQAGRVPDEVRGEVRAKIRAAIEAQYAAQGNDPRAFEPQIQGLTRGIERAYLDQGLSLEEIQERIRAGEIRP